MIEGQKSNLDISWPWYKTIRADLITNQQLCINLTKFVLLFFILALGTRLLPNDNIITSYTPDQWSQTDEVEIHEVTPLNRYLKVYVMPNDKNESIDSVNRMEVYSLKDSEQDKLVMEMEIQNLDEDVDISNNDLRFYLGDVHILSDVAYKVKILKPMKEKRVLQQTQTNLDQIDTQNEQSNSTEIEDNRKKQEEKQRQQQRKRQQQRRKKEEEEIRKIQEIRKKEQQNKKIQEQKQKEQKYNHTNILVQVHLMSSFASILDLTVRYISMLMIIYITADNPNAPKALSIICAITSNPLLFLQISYPNIVSSVIQSLCRSGPLLYFPLWLYYIHTKIRASQSNQSIKVLVVKIILGFTLYVLNTIRLLHFRIFTLQVIFGFMLLMLVGSYLWQVFLDIRHQHHRDKVLIVTTFIYLGCLFTFNIVMIEWKDLIFYAIHQIYGFYLIYLMGSDKNKQKTKLQRSGSNSGTDIPGQPEQLKQKQQIN